MARRTIRIHFESSGNGTYHIHWAWLNQGVMQNAAAWMLTNSKVHTLEADMPVGVEGSGRECDGKTLWILVSLSGATQTVRLQHAKTNVLTDKLDSELTLQRFDVAVLC